MNILLIKPAWYRAGPFAHCVNVLTGPLSLGMLAALSKGHDVTIIDQDIEPVPFSDAWDLVGVTTPTASAPAAYAIADKFRSLGVPVVLGGIHPSLMPEEALKHADSVVVGEAEPVWPEILADFPRLKACYRADTLVDLDALPLPRRDLFHPSYRAAAVQATRGCVNHCRYCYLQNVSWKGYRQQSLDKIYEDISLIKEPYLFFVDDNLFVDKAYTRAMAERITPLKKFWSCQAPMDVAADEGFVRVLARSGLAGVMLGLDSIHAPSRRSAAKYDEFFNLKHTVKRLHAHGIGVGAMLVFGFDHDDAEVFAKTMDYLVASGVDSAVFFTLTPYPGTPLFADFKKEGRILTEDWSCYNWMHTVFRPRRLFPQELTARVQAMYGQFARRKCRKFLTQLPFYVRMLARSPRLAWDLRHYFWFQSRASTASTFLENSGDI